MLLFYAIVDFYLLYDGAFDMQIWALLTRFKFKDTCKCRVSDTQAIDKAWEYLVQ